MFSLTTGQNTIILDTLKAEPELPESEMVGKLVKLARIERAYAEAYTKSWRFNHPNQQTGAIGVILNAVNVERGTPTEPTQKVKWVQKEDGTFDVEKPAKVKAQRGERVLNGEGPIPNINGGIVQQILALHEQGLSNNEIIDKGYNKSTVYRQVSEHKARKKATIKE